MDLDAEMKGFLKIRQNLNHNALNNPKVSIINQDAYVWDEEINLNLMLLL